MFFFIKKVILFLLFILPLSINAYFTQKSSIYDNDGAPLSINGVNWSGFQDTNIFQGLQSNALYNYQNKLGLLELLVHPDKYNALVKTIRIPIQPGILYDEQNEVNINLSLTHQSMPFAGNGLFCKDWQNDGRCAKSISSKKAFWVVLHEFEKKGLHSLIDIHHSNGYGDDKRDGTVYNMVQYEKDISYLAKKIADEHLTGVIGIDIFNEPYRLNWFQSNQDQVPWTKVIATAANAIYQNNPDLLLFVEGPNSGSDDQDEPAICVPATEIVEDHQAYTHSPDPSFCGNLERVFFKGNWGEDFKPLLNPISAQQNRPEFDIRRLRQELRNQGILEQALIWLLGDEHANHAHIVFSPHVYPAEVAGWESAPGKPSQLRFEWSWGFIHQAGYPIVLGEASWKTESGKQFFTQALMPYLATKDSTHNVFFWAIGYLGDTISVINPQTGEWNQDAYETLARYFY